MDYTFLIVLLIVVSLFGLTTLAIYLRKKNVVTAEDLLFSANLLGLSIQIINQLNLQHEDKIREISNIVIDAVDYVVKNMDESNNRVQVAYDYALIMCDNLKITLTDERKVILKELIELSFSRVVMN
jgi:hypothetical protein